MNELPGMIELDPQQLHLLGIENSPAPAAEVDLKLKYKFRETENELKKVRGLLQANPVKQQDADRLQDEFVECTHTQSRLFRIAQKLGHFSVGDELPE